MPVLIRSRVEGMDSSKYDEIASRLVSQLKKQPGFLLHVTYEGRDSKFGVSEIWESKEQHDQWFDNHVKPNLPGEATQEVIELHSYRLRVNVTTPGLGVSVQIHPSAPLGVSRREPTT